MTEKRIAISVLSGDKFAVVYPRVAPNLEIKYRGSQGAKGDQGIQGPIGPDRLLVWTGSAYPTRPDTNPVIFSGPSSANPDTLGLMLNGDSWINTSESVTTWPLDLVGSGSPLGVVSAPVGSSYRDRDGTAGAWIWRKQSGAGNTGWECVEGDTGWRYLIREASPGTDGWALSANWAMGTGTQIAVRRIGRIVYCRLIGSLTYSSTAGQQKQILSTNMPSGFNSYYAMSSMRTSSPLGAVGFGPAMGAPPTALCADAPANPTVLSYGIASWTTNDAWPTSLPGTAATS